MRLNRQLTKILYRIVLHKWSASQSTRPHVSGGKKTQQNCKQPLRLASGAWLKSARHASGYPCMSSGNGWSNSDQNWNPNKNGVMFGNKSWICFHGISPNILLWWRAFDQNVGVYGSQVRITDASLASTLDFIQPKIVPDQVNSKYWFSCFLTWWFGLLCLLQTGLLYFVRRLY